MNMKYFKSFVLTLFLTIPAFAQGFASGGEQSTFTIGTGDVLEVSVWGEEALNMRVLVRPDGRISFPLVNELEVRGLTPDEVRNRLTNQLAKVIKNPNVTVVVAEINSFRVFVLGEVNTQGALNFQRPTRVLEALAEAGGLTEFSKKEIILLRNMEDGSQLRQEIDYKKIVQGDPKLNLYLVPGDTLIVN